jgi:hypothetical protein
MFRLCNHGVAALAIGSRLRTRSSPATARRCRPAPSCSGDYYLDAIVDGRIELAIVYCSSRARNGFKPVGLPAGR